MCAAQALLIGWPWWRVQAYYMYKRFGRMAIEVIPDHIRYRDAVFNRDRQWLSQQRVTSMVRDLLVG